ncbi:uncharacterized protein An01g11090 [Aspergillus niger]|uniref:Contig An01c0340, genomic contig n=2 Tax=Aspergillus niger TaxID=5061 RepID=A2QAD4_ASPNC|nr:uncharacterized protein An01g11090 [Aspergillus niger]CAK44015.1 unnamed protein product [Aspergillus niger]
MVKRYLLRLLLPYYPYTGDLARSRPPNTEYQLDSIRSMSRSHPKPADPPCKDPLLEFGMDALRHRFNHKVAEIVGQGRKSGYAAISAVTQSRQLLRVAPAEDRPHPILTWRLGTPPIGRCTPTDDAKILAVLNGGCDKRIGEPSADGGGDIQAETKLIATFKVQDDHGCLRGPIYTPQLNSKARVIGRSEDWTA